jgi:hypothetical protein
MKGAKAELSENIINAPSTIRKKIIGISHHFFLVHRNLQNSRIVDNLLIISPFNKFF